MSQDISVRDVAYSISNKSQHEQYQNNVMCFLHHTITLMRENDILNPKDHRDYDVGLCNEPPR